MQRHAVQSEAIRSVGYLSGTLEIELQTGAVYRYFPVPERVHRKLMQADSHGRFFSSHVRDRFRFQRLGAAGSPRAASLDAPEG
jgi:hypothetical protein